MIKKQFKLSSLVKDGVNPSSFRITVINDSSFLLESIDYGKEIIDIKGLKNSKLTIIQEENNDDYVISIESNTHKKAMKIFYFIKNRIHDLVNPPSRLIHLNGIGYKVLYNSSTRSLELSLQYHQPKIIPLPEGIQVEGATSKSLELKSNNARSLGIFCNHIQSLRKPDPFKGKGVYVFNKFNFKKKDF